MNIYPWNLRFDIDESTNNLLVKPSIFIGTYVNVILFIFIFKAPVHVFLVVGNVSVISFVVFDVDNAEPDTKIDLVFTFG